MTLLPLQCGHRVICSVILCIFGLQKVARKFNRTIKIMAQVSSIKGSVVRIVGELVHGQVCDGAIRTRLMFPNYKHQRIVTADINFDKALSSLRV